MTERNDIDADLAAQLRRMRPPPAAAFDRTLRARLLAIHSQAHRPDHLWALVGAYAGGGALLLLLGALGASGAGPFGS